MAWQSNIWLQQTRASWLVGPGGIGKTRLALQAAREQLAHFEHGVFFVSLAPLQSEEIMQLTPEGGGNKSQYRLYFELAPKSKLDFILDAANYISGLTDEQNGKTIRNGKERLKKMSSDCKKLSAFAFRTPRPLPSARRSASSKR